MVIKKTTLNRKPMAKRTPFRAPTAKKRTVAPKPLPVAEASVDLSTVQLGEASEKLQ